MTNDQIENFLVQKNAGKSKVQISFRSRNAIVGQFIKTSDYDELKSKNLWRIVNELSIDAYRQTNDISLARIFNGVEFTRLNNLAS